MHVEDQRINFMPEQSGSFLFWERLSLGDYLVQDIPGWTKMVQGGNNTPQGCQELTTRNYILPLS